MRISDWSSDVCSSDLISARSLHDRLATFAAGRASFRAPPLKVSAIGTFIALPFSEPAPEMRALADAAVHRLDALRAPLTPRAVERPLQPRLPPRQDRESVGLGKRVAGRGNLRGTRHIKKKN